MKYQTIKSIAFWVMILMVASLSVYVYTWIKTESFECLNNPYSYSVKLLERSNSAPVTCTCTPQSPNGMSVLLTRDGFKELPLS